MNTKFKELNWDKIILFLGMLFLFFLSRRGGDSKDKVAILLMISTIIYSFKNRCYNKYFLYKKEIIIGLFYILLVSLSYFLSDSKGENRFYTYTHATIFSIGFFLFMLNYKLNKRYIKYIFPILIFISIPPILYGLKDIYVNYNILKIYRIAGNTYTTKYALELGIYFLIGFFSYIYYRNKYIRVLLALYILTNIVLILATQSRNTFLMLPIIIIITIFIYNFKKGIVALIICFSLTFIISKAPLNIKAANRISNSITSVEKIKKDARYLLFKEGIEISKNNILKGDGFFKYKGSNFRQNAIEQYVHYHNIFIETAVTQGLLTLGVYIIFLLLLFYRLIRNYFMENNELKKNIKLMTVAIFLFSHLYGLAEPIFYFEKLYQLIFTIITISVIIDEISIDKNQFKKKGKDEK